MSLQLTICTTTINLLKLRWILFNAKGLINNSTFNFVFTNRLCRGWRRHWDMKKEVIAMSVQTFITYDCIECQRPFNACIKHRGLNGIEELLSLSKQSLHNKESFPHYRDSAT